VCWVLLYCGDSLRSNSKKSFNKAADIAVSKISISSPIARALIGKEEGDVVAVQAPGGNREVEILAVRYI